jgi:glucose/arabinose dehydrogenase
MARKHGRRLAAAGLMVASASLATGGAAHAATGDIFTVAGSAATTYSGDGGPATAAGLLQPTHVAAMPDGGFVVADSTDYRVRRVGASGRIKTIAGTGVPGYSGDGGPGELAQLSGPSGLAAMADGSVLIADLSNNRIRRVAPDGTISTFAGNGTAGFAGDGGPATTAQLRFPDAVAVARDGSVLIADRGNERVRRVSPGGTITTVAGDGTAGFTGDGGPAAAAELNGPVGVAVAPDGGVLIADSENQRVRRVSPDGTITTVAGTGTLGYSGDGGPAT